MYAPHIRELQQYLPFTVLKHINPLTGIIFNSVATVLTVYGIETTNIVLFNEDLDGAMLQQYLPFTVLKHPSRELGC